MSCPDGYHVRPVTADDLDRVVELLNHDARAVTGFPVTWRALLKASWESPAVELGNDMFVVVEDASGDVVAYSELFGSEPYVDPIIIGCVDPHHLGRRLGSFLIEEGARRAERFVAKAPPDRAVVLRVGSFEEHDSARAVLRRAGCTLVRRFPLMRRDFVGIVEVSPLPEGLELRSFAAGREARTVYDTHVEAFDDHFGEGHPTFESWSHDLITSDGALFDPDLWLLAWDRDELAGLAIAADDVPLFPGYGYVLSLGVRRPWRSRGLGLALLTAVFARIQAKGARGALLNVDAESQTGANRLYERAGMRQTPDYVIWERPIRPAIPG